MERRIALPVLLVAVLAIVCIPLPGSSAEVTGNDISVTIPTGFTTEEVTADSITVSTDVTVKNGKSSTLYAYIDNGSDSFLSVTPSGSKSSEGVEVGISADRNKIGPSGDDDKHICTITLTVSIDNYTDAKSAVLIPYVTLMETSERGASSITVYFEVEVTVDSSFDTDSVFNKFLGIFPNTLPSPLDSVWFTMIVTLIVWLLATYLVVFVAVPLLTRVVGFKKSAEEKEALRRGLTKTISLLMLIIAINQCAMICGAPATVQHTIQTFSMPLAVIVLAYISWQIYMFIITAFFTGVGNAVDVDGVDTSLIPLFKMIGKLIIAVAATAAILAFFGVDLGGILVSAGVVSLGITLGAQNTLNQFFSGLVLLSTRPFKKGDFVKIGGETYIVEKVRIMFTEFRNWTKDQIITMPNNAVTGATIINHTRNDKNTVIYIYMEVAYDTNLTLAKELMIKAAKMHPHVVLDGLAMAPGTRLTQFMDSGIEYRLGCTVDDFDNSGAYAGQIREIIFKLFKDNGVEIPYNRLEVTMLPCDGKRKPGDVVDRFLRIPQSEVQIRGPEPSGLHGFHYSDHEIPQFI